MQPLPPKASWSLAVIGAEGAAAQILLRRALDHGCDVRALVGRSKAANLRHERLEWIAGDLTDARRLRETVYGASHVVCMAGPSVGATASARMAWVLVKLHQIMLELRVERLLYQASALCRLPGKPLDPRVAWYRHTVGRLAGLEPRLADHDEALDYLALNMMPEGFEVVVTLPGGWRVRASPPQGPLAVCERPALVSPSGHDLAVFTLEAMGMPELAGRYLYLG